MPLPNDSQIISEWSTNYLIAGQKLYFKTTFDKNSILKNGGYYNVPTSTKAINYRTYPFALADNTDSYDANYPIYPIVQGNIKSFNTNTGKTSTLQYGSWTAPVREFSLKLNQNQNSVDLHYQYLVAICSGEDEFVQNYPYTYPYKYMGMIVSASDFRSVLGYGNEDDFPVVGNNTTYYYSYSSRIFYEYDNTTQSYITLVNVPFYQYIGTTTTGYVKDSYYTISMPNTGDFPRSGSWSVIAPNDYKESHLKLKAHNKTTNEIYTSTHNSLPRRFSSNVSYNYLYFEKTDGIIYMGFEDVIEIGSSGEYEIYFEYDNEGSVVEDCTILLDCFMLPYATGVLQYNIVTNFNYEGNKEKTLDIVYGYNSSMDYTQESTFIKIPLLECEQIQNEFVELPKTSSDADNVFLSQNDAEYSGDYSFVGRFSPGSFEMGTDVGASDLYYYNPLFEVNTFPSMPYVQNPSTIYPYNNVIDANIPQDFYFEFSGEKLTGYKITIRNQNNNEVLWSAPLITQNPYNDLPAYNGDIVRTNIYFPAIEFDESSNVVLESGEHWESSVNFLKKNSTIANVKILVNTTYPNFSYSDIMLTDGTNFISPVSHGEHTNVILSGIEYSFYSLRYSISSDVLYYFAIKNNGEQSTPSFNIKLGIVEGEYDSDDSRYQNTYLTENIQNGMQLNWELSLYSDNNPTVEDSLAFNTISYYFETFSNPELTLSAADIVGGKSFSGHYSQSENIGIKYYQFFLYNTNGQLISNTEKIFSDNIFWEVSTLIPGHTYKVKLIAESQKGQVVSVDRVGDEEFITYSITTTPLFQNEPICIFKEDLQCVEINCTNPGFLSAQDYIQVFKQKNGDYYRSFVGEYKFEAMSDNDNWFKIIQNNVTTTVYSIYDFSISNNSQYQYWVYLYHQDADTDDWVCYELCQNEAVNTRTISPVRITTQGVGYSLIPLLVSNNKYSSNKYSLVSTFKQGDSPQPVEVFSPIIWTFFLNGEEEAITQNQDKTVFTTFAETPKVSVGGLNYDTGSLSCLLGNVLCNGEYREDGYTLSQWKEFIASNPTCLFKNPKGEVKIVSIDANSTRKYMNEVANYYTNNRAYSENSSGSEITVFPTTIVFNYTEIDKITPNNLQTILLSDINNVE